jgi:hypothetical protein
VATTVLGGLASVAGGGKFANGALTAAFGYLMNTVGLACREILDGSASHCGLFIYSGDQIKAQFSLTLNATTFNTDPVNMEADRAAFFSENVYPVSPPNGVSQEEFEKSVEDYAKGYVGWTYNPYAGPNSNSAAAFPLIMSGAIVPYIPMGTLGAWQISYWSSHEYVCPGCYPGRE